MTVYRKIASLKTTADFLSYLASIRVDLPFEPEVLGGPKSPFAQPIDVEGHLIPNRFCVLPMEGWDGTLDGRPSELTFRRWQRFGLSGAKLVWGCEAAAVRPDGRANPNQLMITRQTMGDLVRLRHALVESHRASTGSTEGLYVGLQLTHSGRYCRWGEDKLPKPRLAYDHPLLNPRVGLPIPSGKVFSDEEIEALIEDFVQAALLAQEAGFDFVDVKHCHGYLGHEFLSAVSRPGKFGGSFENRTRFGREIIQGIRRKAPALGIGVRFSAFDFIPFQPGPDNIGQPMPTPASGVPFCFGGDGSGQGVDLAEPLAFLDMLHGLGVRLVCITGGSPYYNPHIQRPAFFPPSDGYQPPEDPLVGVARQIWATAQLKTQRPDMIVVGSAYSYLQEWLPNVAQAVLRQGGADFIGLGRLMLAYPQLPLDVLARRLLQRKLLCRTFSDCTTAPRMGLVSGCYPIDEFYKNREQVPVKRGKG